MAGGNWTMAFALYTTSQFVASFYLYYSSRDKAILSTREAGFRSLGHGRCVGRR